MNKSIINCRASTVAVSCLLLLAPFSLCGAQDSPLRRPALPAELPFHLSHHLLLVLKGRIGSLTNLRFVLDTGTTRTVLDRRLGDRLQLSCRSERSVIRFNTSLSLRQCILPQLEIGPLRWKDLPVSVASLPKLSSLLDKADAIIGLDVLGTSKLIVDYTSSKVIFQRSEPPLAKASKNPDDPLCFTILIHVQGHPVRLILDTGIEGLFLYQDRLQKRVPHLKVAGAPEKVNIGGLPAEQVALPGVQIGKAKKNCTAFLIADPPKNSLLGIDGFIGISELNPRRVTFDFVGRTLTLEH